MFGKWKSGISTLIVSINGLWVCPRATKRPDGLHCYLLARRSYIQTCVDFLLQSREVAGLMGSTTKMFIGLTTFVRFQM